MPRLVETGTGACLAPGLMETINSGGARNDGRTEEVPDELREQAIRLVLGAKAEPGSSGKGCVQANRKPAGDQAGYTAWWAAQAEIDAGSRPETTTDQAAQLAELERENRELRQVTASKSLELASCQTTSRCAAGGDVIGGSSAHKVPASA